MNTKAISNSVASKMIFALLLGLPLAGCDKNAPKTEPVTTYKYDPLKEVAAQTKTAAHETAKKPSRAIASTKAAPKQKTYVVQIGAFTKKENAEKLLKQLEAKSYPVFLKTLEHKTHGSMYLVRLEPMLERTEAEMLLSQLKESEKLTPVIIIPGFMKQEDERVPATAPTKGAAAPAPPHGKAL